MSDHARFDGRRKAFYEVLTRIDVMLADTVPFDFDHEGEEQAFCEALRQLRAVVEKLEADDERDAAKLAGAEAVVCPRCGAAVGAPCVRVEGEPFARRRDGGPHQARRSAARQLREKLRDPNNAVRHEIDPEQDIVGTGEIRGSLVVEKKREP